jgi:hypothetical protein
METEEHVRGIDPSCSGGACSSRLIPLRRARCLGSLRLPPAIERLELDLLSKGTLRSIRPGFPMVRRGIFAGELPFELGTAVSERHVEWK